MPPLVVDPAALDSAGATVTSVGDGLAAAIKTATSTFGVNTGQDLAGEMFGLAYQDAAKDMQKAAAAAVNACRKLGFMVQASAVNYSKAEAASTLGGDASVLPTPTQPGLFGAPDAPWTLGPGVPPPALWALVEAFVGSLWPNGDPAGLRATAGSWRTLGAAFDAVNGELSGPNSVIGAQVMPESGLVHNALSKLSSSSSSIGAHCGKLAGELDGFANEVQHTQNAIRDLLHRLGSASGLWHEVVAFFQGDGLQELKKIADDIKAVLHSMKREADARTQAIKQGMGMLDGAVVTLEGWVRKELTTFFGDEVGNPMATAFDTFTNMQEGILKGVVGLEQGLEQLSPLRSVFDPQGSADAWKGLGKTLFYADPALAPLHPDKFVDTVKEIAHTEDWRADRPGLGLGENLFDVGTLVAPGAGELGAGAKTAAAGARAAEESADAAGIGGRAAGAVGDLGRVTESMSGIGKAAGDLSKSLDGIGRDLPKTDLAQGGKPLGLPPSKPGEPPVELPHSPVESRSSSPAELGAGELSKKPAELLPQPSDQLPAHIQTQSGLAAGHQPGSSTSLSGSHPSSGEPHEHSTDGAPHGPGDDGGSHLDDGDQGGQHLTPIDSKDSAAFSDYTGEGFSDLNDALRSGTVNSAQQIRVDALNEALNKLPEYAGSVTRGTDLPTEALEEYRPGAVIQEDAFLSTTTNKIVANAFGGNVEFRIFSATGRDISSYSRLPWEEEVLFPSHTQFYVLSRTTDATGKTIIEMFDLGR